MRLTLRQLEIFQAVALRGSTSAAALSVPLSQSATSAAVNELERILRIRLFDRIGKRLLLNDSGRALLPAALAVLDGARNIEDTFGSGERGAVDLKIFSSTTIGNYVLPRVLARYRESHPNARLELRIGNTLDVVTAVSAFTTDLGFIEGPCHAPDVTVVPWLEDELVIVAAPTHPLALSARGRGARGGEVRGGGTRGGAARGDEVRGGGARGGAARGGEVRGGEVRGVGVSAKQLMQALWLLREPGSGTREAVEQALSPHLPNLQSTMILGSSEAIKNAAAAGLGLSCLSRAAVQDLVNAKRLTVLATGLPRLTRRFSLIHHRAKVLSKGLRAFVDHCETSGQRAGAGSRVGSV